MVLGLDPGYRNGCKLAVVAEDGSLLECSVVYPNPPQQQTGPAAETLLRLAARYNVLSFAVGNGQVLSPFLCLYLSLSLSALCPLLPPLPLPLPLLFRPCSSQN